jgi:Na+/H+ antiporter NhaD/arsenite permease-like protein
LSRRAAKLLRDSVCGASLVLDCRGMSNAIDPHPAAMLPFVALLLAIAFAPFVLRHHWERHYRELCVALPVITAAYYIVGWRAPAPIVHALLDYLSFIVVVGSFYTVAAGIYLRTHGAGRPLANTLFLLGGGLAANLIGTIGASMLLIRPWITMNRHRFERLHIAFFIFVVSNIGGALLPVGPPLFLGYLKGVPFAWALQRCSLQWAVTLSAVLIVFYVCDRIALRRFRRSETIPTEPENWRCDGARNFPLLIVLLAALIGLPPVWREAVMSGTATIAFFATPKRVHNANAFTFAPAIEVGWIFFGIFGTMPPVLDYMKLHAADIGLRSDMQFYWATGILSALLDNAPTYLTFFAAALGLHRLEINNAAHVAQFITAHDHHLIAISLAATCFGALSYIGNGPNLLVKAIADHAGMRTPSFFGFVFKWAAPVLLPIFALVSLIFFRH